MPRLLIALITVQMVAMGSATASAESTHTPTHYLVFVDRTASIAPLVRTQWRQQMQVLVDAFGPGDYVEVYEMHGSTGDAGMVTHGSAYHAPYDATLAEKGREKRELRELREAITAKTAPLLDTSVASIETDVTGFVNRITSAQGRTTRVVIFSDLINETPALNLSKRAMTDPDIAPTITRLARAAHSRRRPGLDAKRRSSWPPHAAHAGYGARTSHGVRPGYPERHVVARYADPEATEPRSHERRRKDAHRELGAGRRTWGDGGCVRAPALLDRKGGSAGCVSDERQGPVARQVGMRGERLEGEVQPPVGIALGARRRERLADGGVAVDGRPKDRRLIEHPRELELAAGGSDR